MCTIFIGIGTALIYHFLWFPFVERQKILQNKLNIFLDSIKRINKLLKSYHFQIIADSKNINKCLNLGY